MAHRFSSALVTAFLVAVVGVVLASPIQASAAFPFESVEQDSPSAAGVAAAVETAEPASGCEPPGVPLTDADDASFAERFRAYDECLTARLNRYLPWPVVDRGAEEASRRQAAGERAADMAEFDQMRVGTAPGTDSGSGGGTVASPDADALAAIDDCRDAAEVAALQRLVDRNKRRVQEYRTKADKFKAEMEKLDAQKKELRAAQDKLIAMKWDLMRDPRRAGELATVKAHIEAYQRNMDLASAAYWIMWDEAAMYRRELIPAEPFLAELEKELARVLALPPCPEGGRA